MRLGIGLGLFKQAAVSVGVRLFSAYKLRVIADGGTVEADNCAINALNNGLFQRASLLLIPSGYKSGKAYAEIPTNGNGDLTWTRASDAWRTNAEGLIQRVPWNLLQYSNTFSNGVWVTGGYGNLPTLTANSIANPVNGLTDAWTASFAAAGTQGRLLQLFTGLSNGVPYTYSMYIKAGTKTSVAIYSDTATVGLNAIFNLSNGTISSTSGTTATITAMTNGWYYVTITNNILSSGNGQYGIVTNTGEDGTLYIYGAQLNIGATAKPYFSTTDRLNVPRLSYMYGSCPALLLEPQRTNLALQSESFDNASWVKDFSSVTANTTTSPDGNTNADTYTGNGTTSVKLLYQGISVTNGTTYTSSIYAKKNTNNFIQILTSSAAFGANFWANFDLNSGVVGSVGSSATAKIESVGNGWYRCSITGTATATGTYSNAIYSLITSATSTRSESNSLSTSVFVYGAQFEVGAYSSTLIPTTTASATRIADTFSRSNIYTNGLITSSGGTWFVELRGNNLITRDGFSSLGIFQTSATTNSWILFNGSNATGDRIQIAKFVSGTPTTVYTTTTATTKIAIKWNGSTADVFVNGTKVVSATSFTTTQMENLNGATGMQAFIQAMALYPTPLSDTDCTIITTL